jgi:hypothetical protein
VLWCADAGTGENGGGDGAYHGMGMIENRHLTNVESPPPPPRARMRGLFRTGVRPMLYLLLLLRVSV